MSMLSSIIGFSFVGLAARLGQLSIQQRNLFSNPGAHAISMGVFGYAGYWIHKWDIRAAEIIADSKAQLAERRRNDIQKAEAAAARQLEETS